MREPCLINELHRKELTFPLLNVQLDKFEVESRGAGKLASPVRREAFDLSLWGWIGAYPTFVK
jgi:hypothetical protein